MWGSFGGGDQTQDVLQYYLGAYLAVPADGLDDNGGGIDAVGVGDPFTGLSWGLDDPTFASNTLRRSLFLTTSGILPVDQYKQFESWASARYDKPGGPFDPHTGTEYVYSQIADVSYKRLTRQVAVPAGGGSLTFWTSYDTEAEWDHLFVEARTPGGDDWTTLPDANGNTTTDPGQSCAAGWVELHPQLAHYQTWNGVDSCTSSGTNGGVGTRRAETRGVGRSGASTSTTTPTRPSRSPSPTPATGPRKASASSSTTSRSPTDQHLVRDRPGRLGDRRAASGQRTQRQQLHPNRRIGLPGRQRDLHAALAAAGVRAGGSLDRSRTQRGDGPRPRPPAGLARSPTRWSRLKRGERT